MGPQRAASRHHAVAEGRQGRRDRHADGGRDVGQARPRRPSGSSGRPGSITSRGACPTIPGVTTAVVQPDGLSNRTPSLRVRGIAQQLGISGEDTSPALLLDGEPRIALDAARGGRAGSRPASAITPYMLPPGEKRSSPTGSSALLSKPPSRSLRGAASHAGSRSDRPMERAHRVRRGRARPTCSTCTQTGNDLGGLHQGDFVTRDSPARIDGDAVRIRSAYGEQHGDAVSLTFAGKVSRRPDGGDARHGRVSVGDVDGEPRDGRRG